MSTFTHSLAEELRRAAVDSRDKPFIRMMSGQWTYGEIHQGSDRLAANLHAKGVCRGHNVSLMLPNCVEFALAWFALAKLGAVCAPLNTSFRGQTLTNAIDLVESRLLIVHEGYWAQIAEVRDQLRHIDQIILVGSQWSTEATEAAQLSLWHLLESESYPFPELPCSTFSDLCLLLYTSGTTGRSKAAKISNRFVLRHGQGVIDGLQLRPDDVLYCPYPMFHLDAAVMTIAPALLLRAVAAIGERFSVSRYWDEVRTLGATIFDFMGATLTMLWKQPPSARDDDNPARLGWGVPLPAWAPEFEARFGCKLVELYGSTEVGGIIYTPLDEDRHVGSCGKAVGPSEVCLVDDHGFVVPKGTPGELLVRSNEPSVLMDGYWGMPDATLAAFKDQWFHTGDVLTEDKDGWFYFVGRRKDIVRRRGENISSAEVEMDIENHPEVMECTVVGVPSEMTEEEVMACIVLKEGSRLSPEELCDWCSTRMAKFMVPRFVKFLPSLPKTPTDKVEKFKLIAQGSASAWDRENPPNRANP
jgi:crotonobetaine/carnitine-CoA ligase